jgi:hypothetical protein
MGVTLIGPDPVDPDCLHCYLPEVIEAWRKEHPHVPLREVIGQVGQLVADMLASDTLKGTDQDFARFLAQLTTHIMKCATEGRITFLKEKVAARN